MLRRQAEQFGMLQRATLRAALDEAASGGGPLAWVSSRPQDERQHDRDDSWELELRVWPGPVRLVAHVDYHGNWIDWLA